MKKILHIKNGLVISLAINLIAICLISYDILKDLESGVIEIHIYHELRVFIPLISSFLVMSYFYYKVEKENNLKLIRKINDVQNLKKANSDLKLINEKIRKELHYKINIQFELWKLSLAEQEIGMLLIKGFSIKEISNLRKSSELTVRDQASNIYLKAGLKNRSELTSFFIEDIL